MTARAEQIDAFLEALGWGRAERSALAGDASFRRYERLRRGGESAVLMDAPKPEDVRPFWALAGLLSELGLSPPGVLAGQTADGFLLLEDLGDGIFSRVIESGAETELELYQAAVDLLVFLHQKTPSATVRFGDGFSDGGIYHIPGYSPPKLFEELELLGRWYLPAVLGRFDEAWQGELEAIWGPAFGELNRVPPVLVLRDYHADNLLWLGERKGIQRVGLLDFQDALLGHPAYDLVSLLQDARRDVSADFEEAMTRRYLDGMAAAGRSFDEAEFHRHYQLLGAQRNSKIIGIFSRLDRRDAKPAYLRLIPRVWRYLERNLAHPALADYQNWLDRLVPRELRSVVPDAADQEGRGRPGQAPERAMVLAAGLGKRMRLLTRRNPKALIKVHGRSLIDRALDHLADFGVKEAVVNVHYRADKLEAHLARRSSGPALAISDERAELLETGGGVLKALPKLGGEPFFVVNCDALWTDGPKGALGLLAEGFKAEKMDGLLLLVETGQANNYAGSGDFRMAADGRLARRGEASSAPYVFTGIQLLHPRAFKGEAEGAFSLNRIYDRALEAGRLFGLAHDGAWFHVGTPEAIDFAEQMLEN